MDSDSELFKRIRDRLKRRCLDTPDEAEMALREAIQRVIAGYRFRGHSPGPESDWDAMVVATVKPRPPLRPGSIALPLPVE